MLRTIRSYMRSLGSATLFQANIGLNPLNPEFKSISDAALPFLATSFKSGDIAGLLNALFQTAIVVGGILAVLRFAYAGFKYMGTDLWTEKNNAKQILQDTFLGLVLLLAVWVILYQINPDILNLDILKTVQENPAPSSGGQP